MKLETKVRKTVSEVKFIPGKAAKWPSMIGWIQYVDNGYRIKGLGLHTDGKRYWVQWPWWEGPNDSYFYNKPDSEEYQLALIPLFVEAMERVMRVKSAPRTVAPEPQDKVFFQKVETKPVGQKPINAEGVVYVPAHTRKWPLNF